MKKIGDVFTLIRNGASIKQYDNASGLPITRIETISNKFIDREKMGYADVVDDGKYDDYILQDGDILMSHINSEKHLGKVALYNKFGEEKIIHGMNLLVLRADMNCIIPKYARLYFESDLFLRQIATITKKSVNQASFSLTALKELNIICPDIDVQRGVVAKLEKIEALIGHRKQQLQKLDELVKARFVEMFGQKEIEHIELGRLSDFVTVGIANSATQAYSDSGIVMFRNQNIKENYLDDSDLVYIDEEFANKYKNKKLKAKDILVIRTGYPGVACLVPSKYEGMQTFTTLIVRLKKDIDVLPEFVCHYINSERGKSFVRDNQAGCAQQNFGATALSKMPIPIYSIDKQNEFLSFAQQIDKSKLSVQKSLDKLEILKKALLQKYFG